MTMKLSQINRALKEMEAMCREHRCYLPPFCTFTPEQWQQLGPEYDEIRRCRLGWDITDYGLEDFDRIGFSLITIRNGNRAMADGLKEDLAYLAIRDKKVVYIKEAVKTKIRLFGSENKA